MVSKLQEVVQVVVWGMVLEQVVFLLEQVDVELESLEVEKEEEEMERQQGPGQVEVEPGNLDLAYDKEAVAEEGLVKVLEQEAEEELVQVLEQETEEEQVQVDLELGKLPEYVQAGSDTKNQSSNSKIM